MEQHLRFLFIVITQSTYSYKNLLNFIANLLYIFRNDSVTGIKNMRADVVLPTTNLTNSSSIVFPISTDEKTKINTFIPENTVIEKCSLNETFCIKVDNYPRYLNTK